MPNFANDILIRQSACLTELGPLPRSVEMKGQERLCFLMCAALGGWAAAAMATRWAAEVTGCVGAASPC